VSIQSRLSLRCRRKRSSLPPLVTCSFLLLSSSLKWVSSMASVDSSFCWRLLFSFIEHFKLIPCSILILVTNPVEQHNAVTLKRNSKANQLIQRNESRLVRHEKFQVRIIFARSPFPAASTVRRAQSLYLIDTIRNSTFQLCMYEDCWRNVTLLQSALRKIQQQVRQLCRHSKWSHVSRSNYKEETTKKLRKELRGFSPRANYTGQATAACRQS
jgi:hypothetical protein